MDVLRNDLKLRHDVPIGDSYLRVFGIRHG